MFLVSYPEIKEEDRLPVYVTGIGIDYVQEAVSGSTSAPASGGGSPQILFSVEGTGEITVAGTSCELPAGSGVYLRGNARYHYRPRGEKWRISWLTFGFGVPGCADMLFLGREWCLFGGKFGKEHQAWMRKIYDTVVFDHGGSQTSALLYGILVELNGEISLAEGTAERHRGAQGAAMKEIIAYIDRNYASDITLEQLCGAGGGLSEQYLCRLFKQSTGMRPMEYMLRRRVSVARTYLEKTDMPISEVAARSGFKNTSYFYRNFRKFVGVSPLTYRQNALGLAQSGPV